MRIESPMSTMLVLRLGSPGLQAAGTTVVPVTLDLHGVGFSLEEATRLRGARLQVLVIGYAEGRGGAPVQEQSVV